MGINRRDLVLSTLLPLFGVGARADGGVTVVIKVVAQVIAAAKEAEKAKKFLNWQSDISDRLDDIYGNTLEIIKDLRALRVDIREIVMENLRADFIARVEGAYFELRTVLAGIDSNRAIQARQRERLLQAASGLRTVLGQSDFERYGFSTLPIVLPTFVALRAVLQIARVPIAEIQATQQHMIDDYFRPCMDPEVPGSFAHALKFASGEKLRLRQLVRDGLRPTTLGYGVSGCNDSLNRCNLLHFVTTFTGDPNIPDSVQASPVETRTSSGSAYSAGIAYLNPDPPLIPNAGRPRNIKEAQIVRRDWIGQYNAWTRDAKLEQDKEALLSEHISLIQDALGIKRNEARVMSLEPLTSIH